MGRDIGEQISQRQYYEDFQGKEKAQAALENRLDIRKFEIGLYWKRATSFSAFIAAVFAGYGAVQAAFSLPAPAQTELLVVRSCLGTAFSAGWFCANKGSKQWQENRENHVDILEDALTDSIDASLIGGARCVPSDCLNSRFSFCCC